MVRMSDNSAQSVEFKEFTLHWQTVIYSTPYCIQVASSYYYH